MERGDDAEVRNLDLERHGVVLELADTDWVGEIDRAAVRAEHEDRRDREHVAGYVDFEQGRRAERGARWFESVARDRRHRLAIAYPWEGTAPLECPSA